MHPTITTLPDLIETLSQHETHMVSVELQGQRIKAGYHITELKAADVRSIDCGGKHERWPETRIQLLDGHGRGSMMSAPKFAGILQRALNAVPDLAEGRLEFEFTPKNEPKQVSQIKDVAVEGGMIRLKLAPERAACKAFAGCC